MSQFQKGVLEGFGFVVTMVCLVGLGLALCFGAVGVMVGSIHWMLAIVKGGCA